MRTSIAILLQLLSLSLASPASPRLWSQEIIATLQQVNTYKLLNYSAFNFLNAGVEGAVVTGVVPQSPPICIATGINENVIAGTAQITRNYVGSKVQYFDLVSFYFGCVVNTVETVAGAPEMCTISVTGFRPGSPSKAVDTIDFTFSPKASVSASMIQAVLPSTFSGLERVEFAIVEATGTSTTSAMLVDNVKYRVYSQN
ncbi:MAG: hypothetical protein M1836_005526 [Candelina mexicana]|nr:MAG: hypothetical protein M1836_005526 [Candelina mexicana]